MPVSASIPTSNNLYAAAARIINGYDSTAQTCRVAFCGDSQNDPTNAYSIATQSRGVWGAPWIGAWMHPDSGGDSVIGRASEVGNAFTGGTVNSINPCNGVGTAAPWYPIGAATRAPYIGVCKAAQTNATPVVAEDAALTNYYGLSAGAALQAQWARNASWGAGQITAEAIIYKTPLGFNGSGSEAVDTFNVIPQRSGSAFGTPLKGQTNYVATDEECVWAKYSVTLTAGTNPMRLLIKTANSDTAGAVAREWIIGGAQFFVPNTVGTIHINAFSKGTASATDIDTLLGYSATDLSSYCAALRLTEGAVFFIHLGQNMTGPEGGDIPGVWKPKMLSIVNRLRTAVNATSGAVPPLFVLVSTYQSTGGSGLSDAVCLAQQLALYQLSMEYPDVGFLNLNRLADSGANMLAAGYIPDSIHPAQQNSLSANYQGGSAYFAALEWSELKYAYAQSDPTGRSWRGRGAS